jgi:hypothetical protein
MLALAGCTGYGKSPSPSSPAVGEGPTDQGTAAVPAAGPTSTPTPTAATTLDPPASAAALVTYIKAASAADSAAYTSADDPMTFLFLSPSHNIKCGFGGDILACGIDEFTWAPVPRPAECPVDWMASSFHASSTGVWRGECRGDPPLYAFPTKVLPYGSTISNGATACRSESSFIACANLATGNGFAIARTFFKLYGTLKA